MSLRGMLVVLLLAASAAASPAENQNLLERDSITDGFFGLNDELAEHGIEVGFAVTNIYQANVKGGLSAHNRRGRYSGSYDIEVSADLQKLMGLDGLAFYMLVEGGWTDTEGINDASVGSFFGVNDDALGNRTMDVSEFWFQQAFLDDTLLIRLGKLDLTAGFEHHNCPVSFDCSTYASDETTQFINSALVNNPVIPFPDYGLGIAALYAPIEGWYVSAAVADAQADSRETGFNTAFHDEDYFFYIFETGVTPQLSSANGPLQGAYRVGLWYDPQPKANIDSTKTYRDDVGFYFTCDQMLAKENADPEDSQGLGAFFRYGYASSKRSDLANFFSVGCQYQGLLEGREDDVLAIGFAHGTFSDRASATFTSDYESALEIYYSAQITPWLAVSPNVQYIANPGGDRTVSDAVAFGVRAQMTF